ncbi:MAG: sulfatase-like hydrolase/transferase [Puniceicoccales bacterium]
MNDHTSRPSLSGTPLRIPRRDFLKMVGGLGALGAMQGSVNLWGAGNLAEDIAARRNIILFTTDQQQNLQWFPEGWAQANLPGLTRLQNKGVTFNRGYTNTAMCTPARTTLFTGVYPAQHLSVDTLSEDMSQSEQEHQLDPTIANLGTVLEAEGYDVIWKGKWHMSKGKENPDGSYTSDDISRYGMEDWNSPDAGGDAKLPNYGGGTVNNDGRFFDGSTWQDPVGDPSDPDYIFTQADGPPDPENEANGAMAFLREKINNPGGNPFCLVICLINPHDVLGCPGLSTSAGGNGTYIEGGYVASGPDSSPWSQHTGPTEDSGGNSLVIEVPPTSDENLINNLKPTCQEQFRLVSAGLGPVPTDAKKLEYLNFYGNLMKLNDRKLSAMLDLLDGLDGTVDAEAARALRDNTWTIFTSDHGDLTMSHGGLRQKSFMCYEENVNVPLVWSNPVDFPTGQECDELVSHVDFLPTLCAKLGIDTTSYDFRGVDYSSLIEDPAGAPVQDSILFTFDDIWSGQDAAGKPNGIVNPPNRLRALIEKDFKYVYYFDGFDYPEGESPADPQDEFYDLRSNTYGGTDTDISNGLGNTGKAVEYTNYSVWAENQRTEPLATPALATKRTEMEQALNTAIDTKLAPRAQLPAVPPESFQVIPYAWIDENQTPQTALQVTWLSRCTTQYQLQVSDNLEDWEDVGDLIPGTNGPIWVDQPTAPKSFYRLTWSQLDDVPTPQPDIVVT